MTHDLEQIYAYVTGLWRPDAAKSIGAPDELTADQDRLLGELQRDIWEALQRRKEEFMPDKVKVVLDIEPSGVRVGIGAEGCDPIIRPLEGDLAVALGQLPALVDAAKEQWEAAPRNPNHVKPRASRAKKADAADPPADAAAAQPPAPETSAEPPADAAATEAVPAAPNHTAAEPTVGGVTMSSELPLLEGGDDRPGAPEAELAAEEQEATAAAASVTEAIAAPEPTVGGVTMFPCPKCTFQAYSEAALGDHEEHTHPDGESDGESGSPEAPDAPEAAEETTQAPEPVEAVTADLARAPEPVGKGKFVIIATGATHDTVHAALLALGETQETLDGKQYWHRLDRLPKRLAEQIRKRE